MKNDYSKLLSEMPQVIPLDILKSVAKSSQARKLIESQDREEKFKQRVKEEVERRLKEIENESVS